MGVKTVLRNARVLTMAEREPAVPHQAIALNGGRICAVGTDLEITRLADASTQVLDLEGRSVLPGFIDCHVHFMQTGLGQLGPAVYGLGSRAEVLEVIAHAVARRARGEPVLVHGCELHALDAPVTAQDLDALAPRNPVMLADVGAHACVCNSRAARLIDLPPDTPGIERRAGQFTGLLRQEANTRARYRFYSDVIDDETRRAALLAASQRALAAGITTVHALDGGSPDGRGWLPQRDAQLILEEQHRLPVRTLLYFQSTHVELARRWGLPQIGGCVWVDGSYFEHTAGLSEPYADQPCTCGALYFTQAELDAFVWEAHHAGMQVALHAIGDAAIEQVLLAYERALQREPAGDHRHRIEHFSLPTERHIERAAALGVIASMQPNFAVHPRLDASGRRTGEGLEALLGAARFERRHPYRRLLEAGVLVAAGSDADPQPMGPLIGVERLASHPEAARRLTVYEALRLYTVNAARAGFEERTKGTLEPGKLADLVVLAEDPLTKDPASLARIPVDMTLVGGRIAHHRIHP